MSTDPSIRTPDERLRVFVSSTLVELASERATVREAIERLRLTPVLFELGARPHPPQDVYQAYLERSDVFIGIYAERYGWIGPGMEISGLEDEYLRSAGKPRLLYVKAAASAREPRLASFIEGLKTDAAVSFKTFHDHDELRELVENDLALLLTERFVSQASGTAREARRASLPSAVDAFVGRAPEVAALSELLAGAARLVTITGPGGVGKTRLAVEAARRSLALFPDGVYFVGLSPVPEAELVPSAILTTLELPTAPTSALTDALIDHLREGKLLLLLDNFEHVLDAAPGIGNLLAACADLRLLVTSRSALRLRGEREFAVAPLPISEATLLFAERASAVTSEFELTERNAESVGEICRHLDGLPLAIELAAARVRTLPAESMLPHLERRLKFLTGGGRDYPERQRTLQSTIDWSFDLLDPSEQELLARASVFRGGWDLAAASAVCGETVDVLGCLESLLEKSLVRRQVVGVEPRFTMLETIREYAADRLEERRPDDSRSRHARFYLDLALTAGTSLRGGAQRAWLDRLELEQGNVREALGWSLAHGASGRVASAGWALMPFWWLRGLFDEGTRWMNEALQSDGLTDVGRAEALLARGFIAFWRADYRTAVPALEEAREIFTSVGDTHRAAMARLPLAVSRAAAGDHSAIAELEESRAVLAETGDEWELTVALNALCWALNMLQVDAPLELFEEARERANAVGTTAELATAIGNLSWRMRLRGETAEAKVLLAQVLAIARALKSPTGVALYVDMVAGLAADEADHSTSALLFSASASIRAAVGVDVPLPVVGMRERGLTGARAALGDDAIEAAIAAGSSLETYEAADEAIAWLAAG